MHRMAFPFLTGLGQSHLNKEHRQTGCQTKTLIAKYDHLLNYLIFHPFSKKSR